MPHKLIAESVGEKVCVCLRRGGRLARATTITKRRCAELRKSIHSEHITIG